MRESPQDWNLTPGHVEPLKVKQGWRPEPSFRTGAQAAVAGGGTPEPRGGDGRAGVYAGVQSSGPGSDGGKQRIRQPRRPSGEDGETLSTTLASREAETAREANGTEK